MYDKDGKREDYWDLGKPREKKYAKPDFDGHTIETTEVSDGDDFAAASGETKGEKIAPRGELNLDADGQKISASFWIDPIGGGKRVVTSSYRRHTAKKNPAVTDSMTMRRSLGSVVASYDAGGMLLKKIEVRTWETDTEFYGRFTSDALLSHRAKPSYPCDAKIDPVPYVSFVPQYAHMNRAQVEYYRFVRENLRQGRIVDCDLPYLQLYIYEIINLADEIGAETGAHLLARIWLGYRKKYPRLDGYLCEWLPDYCLINGVPMPDELLPILGEITPKAQFKEFFLDSALSCGSDLIGYIAAEVASDYDFKSSRYYGDNAAVYDEHIPAALARVIRSSVEGQNGVFSLDRTYKMVRDSYCGAIVSSNIKRRVDVEFCSFTRRADARQIVTAMVKYAENKVRAIIGVKAKLNVDKTDDGVTAMIDGYFAPLLPEKARTAEDRYMPADYLRNYEADEREKGFDFGRAADIEKHSWANTERLTGEEFTAPDSADGETVTVDGEIGFDTVDTTSVETDAPVQERFADDGVKSALRAALDGRFAEYCRSAGKLDGEVADLVNTAMLDVLGDVALEADGASYTLIEDYREDIEQWLMK